MLMISLDVATYFLNFVESGYCGGKCQHLKSKPDDAAGAFRTMTMFMFFHNDK